MKTKIIMLCVIAVIIGAMVLFFVTREQEEEFQLVPLKIGPSTAKGAEIAGTEIGTGWSINENPAEAVRETVNMALEGKKRKNPDFAIIYASSGSDMEGILHAAKRMLGERTKIFGGSSDSRAVMTDKGFVKVTARGYELSNMEGRRGLAIMTVTSKEIIFGVGSGDLSASPAPAPQDVAKTAVLSAIENAGKKADTPPRAIILLSTIGVEEEVIEGIEQVTGKGIVMLGGTVGGPAPAVLGENRTYEKGVCLAVIYTDLPIGWTFEAGFDVTDKHTGIVTKVEGQALVEIDNKPALDVYNAWVDGEIERLHKENEKPDVIRDLLILRPLYRKYTSPSGQDYFLFSHSWPKDDKMEGKSVMTSTKIKAGERVYLSQGTWETLLNRIGNLPRNAKSRGGIRVNARPILSVGTICGGVMGVIPETEREKMSFLINYTNNNGPFIANFTWGEQGHFPGIGSKHGNLSTSFLVIADQRARE
jgi:hypothetical protein